MIMCESFLECRAKKSMQLLFTIIGNACARVLLLAFCTMMSVRDAFVHSHSGAY
jgi:hypothetical protein